MVGTNLVTATLLGDRNVHSARAKPASQAGSRAFVLRQDSTALVGSANATITASGSVRERGTLNENNFVLTSALSKDGTSPFYLSISHGTEAIIGWLEFRTGPSNAVSGTLLWPREGGGAPVLLEAGPQ
jgi:hypothetical protein